MKILQALVVLFAVIGCLALALGGYYIYNVSQGKSPNVLAQLGVGAPQQTTETLATATPAPAASGEYANIINKYQPTPTPAPVVAADGTVISQPAATPVAPIATVPPIKTPALDSDKIRNWPSGRKWVALTYDDGPHPSGTQRVMDLLRSKNVKATFFLQGESIKRFPDIARMVADQGFEIGNHTYSHPNFNLSSQTPAKIREELESTNELIAAHATQKPVRVMRPPYGNTPSKLKTICEEMGMYIITWDVDTDDWRSTTDADAMAENIMKNIQPGSIILMHDKFEKSAEATAKVIDPIRAQGYEFVTLSELLGLEDPTAAPAPAPVAAAPAAPVAAPVTIQPAAPAAATGGTGLPAPAAPAATAPAGAPATFGNLPAPVATQAPAGGQPAPATLAPLNVDSSKITQPPPR